MNPLTFITRGQMILVVLLLALVLPGCAQAQSVSYAGYDELHAPYSRQELAQILAPVALYPDALLAQVLMASTYPIEVIEAERWLRANPGLKNDALDAALLRRNWDPSVKALVHFPSVLTLMSERITETTELGNAFLAQEADVMAMVQELRAEAYAYGTLKSNTRQQVVVETQTIIIRPVNPRVIYVPYYDPFYVYGPWRYSAYPPYYWGPTGVYIGYGIGYWPGYYFNFTYGNWSYFDWHRRVILVDARVRPRFVYHEQWIVRTGTWRHAPVHRRGVAYRDHATASRFSSAARAHVSVSQDRSGTSSVTRQEQNRHRVTTTTRTQSRQVVSRTTEEHRSIQTPERRHAVEQDSNNRNRQQQQRVTTNQQSVTSRQPAATRPGQENNQQRRQVAERQTQQLQVQEQNRHVRTVQPENQRNREVVAAQTPDSDRNLRSSGRNQEQQNRQTRNPSAREQRDPDASHRGSRDNYSYVRR